MKRTTESSPALQRPVKLNENGSIPQGTIESATTQLPILSGKIRLSSAGSRHLENANREVLGTLIGVSRDTLIGATA